MTADTGRLVAQARGLVTTIRVTPPTVAQINSAFAQYESIALALADALEAVEAQRDTLAEAHQAIVARHPDAVLGEHPAVDIARAALAGVAPPEEQP